MGDGVAGLLTSPSLLVGRAQGAEPAQPAPSILAAAERARQAPRLVKATQADRAEWDAFRSRFVAPDGRVVDTGNGGISHTEGQGWGMLLAASWDDHATFERIHGWTDAMLARRGDSLHAWRYVPSAVRPVADLNNASDGDIAMACALWRGAHRWGRADYAEQARAMAHDVLRLLVRRVGSRTVLLPAAFGFEKPDGVDINPSYYSFVFLQELSQTVSSPLWQSLRDDGVAMISEGCFGSCRLPPDWLNVRRADGVLSPAAGWPARFSYDAVRVPLHLAWAGLDQPALRRALREMWPEAGQMAAWVDLRTGLHADYPAPSGFNAIAKIATSPRKTTLPHDFPTIRSSPDYYSAALTLLARLAWQEMALAESVT